MVCLENLNLSFKKVHEKWSRFLFKIDIDECKTIPNLCDGGNCTNTLGSFNCQCSEGQEINFETNRCEDVNECLQENRCLNGKCINTAGSFYCLCNPGFIQAQNRQFCIGNFFKFILSILNVILERYVWAYIHRHQIFFEFRTFLKLN